MNNSIISFMQQARADADIVDLSYRFEPDMPVWPTHARYGAVIYESYDWTGVSMHRQVTYGEHSGTHIDAPRHFFREGKSIDQMDPACVMGRAVTIDASFLQPCEAYTLEHLKRFETEHGTIEAGDIVLFRFGWDDRYGTGAQTVEFLKDWSGLGKDAAQYLYDRGVAAVGTDALALDPFGSPDYPCHQILLGHGTPILENVANLKLLPPFSYVIGLFTKFKDGSGSPINMVAFVQRRQP